MLLFTLLPTAALALPLEFPQNIGFEGTFSTGYMPFLAKTDTKAEATGAPTSSYTVPQPLETSIVGQDSRNVFKLMGTYSPYHVPDQPWGDAYDYSLPRQCTIKQAHSLMRHGARYDTKPTKLEEWMDQYGGHFNASGPLEFLNSWSPNPGLAALTTFGNEELFSKGTKMFYRYGAMLNYTDPGATKIVARTTSMERILESARYFLAGFFGLDWQDYAKLEVQIEALGFNTTLAPKGVCPGTTFSSIDDHTDDFRNLYLDSTQKKLNKYISGQVNGTQVHFKHKYVYAMQRLCAFETVTLGFSKFCDLFTEDDWKGYATRKDYSYYYENSFGNPTSRARGIGWVDELHHRMTQSGYDPNRQTSQNSTFNGNPDYFPVDQSLYLDFTHDTTIVSVLTALGLEIFKTNYTVSKDGNITSDNPNWRVSDMVPFAGQLVFEVIECDQPVPADRSSISEAGPATKYVHAYLNDRTLPLDNRSIEACGARADGWCEFDTFIEHLEKAHDEAQFEYSCFGNYTPSVVTNGVPNV